MIEGTDASYFNANLHPPLMPYEIWTPGGHNSVKEANQLPITDFCIRYEVESDELCLIHKLSGKQALVFNLGFQTLTSRSELFQLLGTFGVPNNGSIPPSLSELLTAK